MPEAPSVLPGANDLEKFHELNKLTYKQQAVWFLNAFWEEFAEKGFRFFVLAYNYFVFVLIVVVVFRR